MSGKSRLWPVSNEAGLTFGPRYAAHSGHIFQLHVMRIGWLDLSTSLVGYAGLHRIGLMNKATMREFDASCLTAVEPLSAKDIIAIRKRAGVSQGVFADYLNVKPKLISEWERGEKRPSGPSLKLLSIVKSKGLDAIA